MTAANVSDTTGNTWPIGFNFTTASEDFFNGDNASAITCIDTGTHFLHEESLHGKSEFVLSSPPPRIRTPACCRARSGNEENIVNFTDAQSDEQMSACHNFMTGCYFSPLAKNKK
ncbi:hypothetical protein TrVE_jg5601 [Triparma verrucosa]|uniref:Uncharacterized protein n=1 Tax=Triparma verrucosa TaxID=1606542 RepID=A0A9W7BEG8_9STRA|nr:hypothetical protein TrVE_jg5601 [Triparma verrucosa]